MPDPNPVLLLTATASQGIDRLQVFGDVAYLRARFVATGLEFWRTDLTRAGTLQLVDSCSSACDDDPSPVVATGNGTLFFTAKTKASSALYTTDGTPAGTTALAAGGAAPTVAVGSKLVFRKTNTLVGLSDGTVAGTASLQSLTPNFFGAENDAMSLGNRALFSTLYDSAPADPNNRYTRRIYGTDGTAAGTVELLGGQYIGFFARLGDLGFVEQTFFAPGALVGTTTLSVTDGTTAGTNTLGMSFVDVRSPAVVGNVLYFTGSKLNAQAQRQSALYRSDAIEITKVMDGSLSVTDFGGVAHFTSGTKIRKTDGTDVGTVDVHDATPGYPSSLTPIGGTLYYVVGSSLWKLEGAPLTASPAAGTKLLKASGFTELAPTKTGVLWTNGTELWHERP